MKHLKQAWILIKTLAAVALYFTLIAVRELRLAMRQRCSWKPWSK